MCGIVGFQGAFSEDLLRRMTRAVTSWPNPLRNQSVPVRGTRASGTHGSLPRAAIAKLGHEGFGDSGTAQGAAAKGRCAAGMLSDHIYLATAIERNAIALLICWACAAGCP